MTPAQQAALDEALRTLRELARAEGLLRIETFVCADGRVYIEGADTWGYSVWSVDADLEPGSALPTPSAALARRGK